MNVPDTLWKEISEGKNLLCGKCIMEKIENRGIYDVFYVSIKEPGNSLVEEKINNTIEYLDEMQMEYPKMDTCDVIAILQELSAYASGNVVTSKPGNSAAVDKKCLCKKGMHGRLILNYYGKCPIHGQPPCPDGS